MLEPSIDHLLKKVDSQYTLVVAAARRARNIKVLRSGEHVKKTAKKPVTMALEEIMNEQLEFQASKESDFK